MRYQRMAEQENTEKQELALQPHIALTDVDQKRFTAMKGNSSMELCPNPSDICPNPLSDGVARADPLSNALDLLQQNIKDLQGLIPMVAQASSPAMNAHHVLLLQHQHSAASTGIANVISQLAVVASGILPTLAGVVGTPQMLPSLYTGQASGKKQPINMDVFEFAAGSDPSDPSTSNYGNVNDFLAQAAYVEAGTNLGVVENGFGHDDIDTTISLSHAAFKKSEGVRDGESNPDDMFDIVEVDPCEILAEHSHFCEICGKGFKRDANLRMHMRGHGDQYKSLEALSGPKNVGRAPSRPRRFSCPYSGCKRNRSHKKFNPLKTMLCVKNHYRRSHCAKLLTCSKCTQKKFAVVADLKTHEKHCGKDKWMCSCGTTFSRKDKLLGHLNLFVGHAPASAPQGEGGGILGLPSASLLPGSQANMQSFPVYGGLDEGSLFSGGFSPTQENPFCGGNFPFAHGN